MATLTSFENMLKEVVTAKRLSASKMNALTDIALKLMDNDTQLVSILYRTHKALSPSSKIHSLYAFDALSRAARSKVNKLGLTGDINAEKGNCATFLLKVDGILDALILDMVSIGTTEAKEKTRKILDIWTKNNTFPQSVLTRLADVAKETPHKGAYRDPAFVFAKYLFCYAITLPFSLFDTNTTSSAPPSDPRATAPGVSPPVQTVPAKSPIATDTAQAQAQALLQAIFKSAVGTSSTSVGDSLAKGSTVNQTGTNAPGGGLQAIDQVALLQQLVERAKAGNNNGATLLSPSSSILPGMMAQPSLSSSHLATSPAHLSGPSIPSTSHKSPQQNVYETGGREDYYGNRGDQRYPRHDENGPHPPERHRNNDEWRDGDRGGWRGVFRGTRGSGRGGRGWRDHDDRDGPPRRRQSRSSSPPRFAGGRGTQGLGRGGRDVRPYSPPRRPTIARHEGGESSSRAISAVGQMSGKDEFGRDIRPSSPDDIPETTTVLAAVQATEHRHPTAFAPVTSEQDMSPSSSKSGGLDQVNFGTFDFSSPAAWEALGKAWEVTHGDLPSQEQLMQLVMGGMSQTSMINNMDQAAGSHTNKGWTNVQQSGKSIPTYESGSNVNTNSWQVKGSTWQGEHPAFDYEQGSHAHAVDADTDAVVLGGDDAQRSSEPYDSGVTETLGNSGTGGMKRVGDGWVWQPS
ncbi:hypothetical protein BU17DRAFT_95419 [Hysterangium stoloniferum]|nr:hypothetical protein BU17DRAFT_95419 [Hysterangium stoloniferum]